MKEIKNLYLLASDTPRARAYIDILLKKKMKFEGAIIFDKKSKKKNRLKTNLFNNETPLIDQLKISKTKFKYIKNIDINSDQIINELKKEKKKYIVFAGPPGSILRKKILSLKHKFIHIHPGDLPKYRGSTTIYYSLLNKDKITATAIFMNREIDKGEIINKMTFTSPVNKKEIDDFFDPYYRSQLLYKIILEYKKKKIIDGKKQKGFSQTYYIIHPLLKHIAILSKRN